LLLCVCAILPEKAIPGLTYSVSGGTLNPTHSLTHKPGKPGNSQGILCILEE